jgi:ABC-2 type transport system permease protein
MKWNRIEALVLKYFYNMRRNLDRVFEIFYFPAIGLFTWGFTTLYLEDVTESSQFIAFFLSGFILWTLVQRAQSDLSTALLEDFWNRNIYNTFSSPLTNFELFFATSFYAVARSLVAFAFLFVLALVFYSFNVLSIGVFGLALLSFILVLFGTAIGAFVSGLIYRFGQRIQVFAWSTILLLQPVSAVFYPRETLPGVFYDISLLVPTSYVFEGMRTAVESQLIPWTPIMHGMGLTLIYMAVGYIFFGQMIERSRKKGYLAQNA